MNAVFRGLTLAALSLSLVGAAQAQTGDVPAAQLKTLQQKLSQRLPSLPPIESARTTPMSGLIELKIGNTVFYSDATGEYLIEGHILETRTQRDLTAERLEEINRVTFNNFPFQDAVMWKNGNGKRRLVVFADPNCGYCKKLAKDIAKLDNITLYVFLYPILSPDSLDKSNQIWCSADKARAWNDWMQDGKLSGKGDCDTSAVRKTVELGRKLAITGTPTLFFADGERVPGAVPLAQIEKKLEQASGK